MGCDSAAPILHDMNSLHQLLNWEGEISVRIWLILQGKMPPFRVQGLKTMPEHCLTQNHAVLELHLIDFAVLRLLRPLIFVRVLARFRVTAPIGVALDAEVVKDVTHVHILACLHVEQGQIYRGATAVA